MPALDLPLPLKLTNKCTKSVKDRVLEAQYGNGYKLTARDGLNSTVEIWELYYSPLTGADLTTVRTFLDTVSTDTWFYWTPFGETTPKKWRRVADSLKETMLNYEKLLISFTVEQQFDLGT